MEEGHSCRMGNWRTHDEQRDHGIILQNAPRTVKPRSDAVYSTQIRWSMTRGIGRRSEQVPVARSVRTRAREKFHREHMRPTHEQVTA